MCCASGAIDTRGTPRAPPPYVITGTRRRMAASRCCWAAVRASTCATRSVHRIACIFLDENERISMLFRIPYTRVTPWFGIAPELE